MRKETQGFVSLRVHLSPLRKHKKCHNVSDTHDIEDTYRYLFECLPFTLAVNVVEVLQNNNLDNLEN